MNGGGIAWTWIGYLAGIVTFMAAAAWAATRYEARRETRLAERERAAADAEYAADAEWLARQKILWPGTDTTWGRS